ncbi:hypothetical protein BCR41DRAFT_387028 [Lobosporangium transversale]|uniref:Uncharacterized protein n=1 Tax=Lobosporangium transversale TaxID=64571 RepID=A0A1Y2GKL3_9FUNG|nr:hypothetical protein BCR41DRAFT_387028 [Lobosporangium transversale]ORZ13784.1 hypothetical protein BCR41DRAFT_387028 [Lobosporangium transversale]|eukprot:XP_021880568.1 hypothetical protein BCR41DRAFT_387028 [Lobosporangium transversale]
MKLCAILKGNITSIGSAISDFENNRTDEFFEIVNGYYQLIRGQVLKATDINSGNETSIVLKFDDYRVTSRSEHSLGPGKDGFLARGYPGYPRFDFMIGPVFIQVSISEFRDHNKESKGIRKAFERPYKDMFGKIKCYLDELYGGEHRVETNAEEVVPGFWIVYICGGDVKLKDHGSLVKELADVAHFDFDTEELLISSLVFIAVWVVKCILHPEYVMSLSSDAMNGHAFLDMHNQSTQLKLEVKRLRV